jgi:broad specificity phosphatase PhoE
MGAITLIRHGQASFGAEDYDRLSDLGRRQARILGAHWGRTGRGFDAVFRGRMRRQRETLEAAGAAPEAPALPAAVESAAWDEYDSSGIWHALLPRVLAAQPELAADAAAPAGDRRAFQRLFSAVMRRWIAGEPVPAGIPSWREFSQAVAEALAEAARTAGAHRSVAVFTSGGPIAAALQAALGLADAAALELSWQIFNASVTRIRCGPRGMALFGFNEVAHLELERDPALLTYR